jgi:hypothetical protein
VGFFRCLTLAGFVSMVCRCGVHAGFFWVSKYPSFVGIVRDELFDREDFVGHDYLSRELSSFEGKRGCFHGVLLSSRARIVNRCILVTPW